MLQSIRKYLIRHVKVDKSVKIAIIVLGLIGIWDTSYLTYSHFLLHPLACFSNEVVKVNSCQVVTDSIYSTVLGVPLALIGLGYYLTVTTLAALSFKEKYTYLLNLILPIASLSSLFSIRLIYLQVNVIGHLCYYCLLSALVSFILLGISFNLYQKIEADV